MQWGSAGVHPKNVATHGKGLGLRRSIRSWLMPVVLVAALAAAMLILMWYLGSKP